MTGLSKDSVAVPLGLELVDRAWLGDDELRSPNRDVGSATPHLIDAQVL